MTTTTFSISRGQTIQLNLEVDDSAGNPITDASGNPSGLTAGPNYSVDNGAIATLVPNAQGVAVTGIATGTVKVTATGTGVGPLVAESDGTVTAPLGVSMTLKPGLISG